MALDSKTILNDLLSRLDTLHDFYSDRSKLDNESDHQYTAFKTTVLALLDASLPLNATNIMGHMRSLLGTGNEYLLNDIEGLLKRSTNTLFSLYRIGRNAREFTTFEQNVVVMFEMIYPLIVKDTHTIGNYLLNQYLPTLNVMDFGGTRIIKEHLYQQPGSEKEFMDLCIENNEHIASFVVDDPHKSAAFWTRNGNSNDAVHNYITYIDNIIRMFYNIKSLEIPIKLAVDVSYIGFSSYFEELQKRGIQSPNLHFKCILAQQWDSAPSSSICKLGEMSDSKIIHERQSMFRAVYSMDSLKLIPGKVSIDNGPERPMKSYPVQVGELSGCIRKRMQPRCKMVTSDQQYLDLKRTGDALQALTILQLMNQPNSFNIFVTKDHLAFLKARLAGVPCMFTSIQDNQKVITLYKPNIDPEDYEKYQKKILDLEMQNATNKVKNMMALKAKLDERDIDLVGFFERHYSRFKDDIFTAENAFQQMIQQLRMTFPVEDDQIIQLAFNNQYSRAIEQEWNYCKEWLVSIQNELRQPKWAFENDEGGDVEARIQVLREWVKTNKDFHTPENYQIMVNSLSNPDNDQEALNSLNAIFGFDVQLYMLDLKSLEADFLLEWDKLQAEMQAQKLPSHIHRRSSRIKKVTRKVMLQNCHKVLNRDLKKTARRFKLPASPEQVFSIQEKINKLFSTQKAATIKKKGIFYSLKRFGSRIANALGLSMFGGVIGTHIGTPKTIPPLVMYKTRSTSPSQSPTLPTQPLSQRALTSSTTLPSISSPMDTSRSTQPFVIAPHVMNETATQDIVFDLFALLTCDVLFKDNVDDTTSIIRNQMKKYQYLLADIWLQLPEYIEFIEREMNDDNNQWKDVISHVNYKWQISVPLNVDTLTLHQKIMLIKALIIPNTEALPPFTLETTEEQYLGPLSGGSGNYDNSYLLEYPERLEEPQQEVVKTFMKDLLYTSVDAFYSTINDFYGNSTEDASEEYDIPQSVLEMIVWMMDYDAQMLLSNPSRTKMWDALEKDLLDALWHAHNGFDETKKDRLLDYLTLDEYIDMYMTYYPDFGNIVNNTNEKPLAGGTGGNARKAFKHMNMRDYHKKYFKAYHDMYYA